MCVCVCVPRRAYFWTPPNLDLGPSSRLLMLALPFTIHCLCTPVMPTLGTSTTLGHTVALAPQLSDPLSEVGVSRRQSRCPNSSVFYDKTTKTSIIRTWSKIKPEHDIPTQREKRNDYMR